MKERLGFAEQQWNKFNPQLECNFCRIAPNLNFHFWLCSKTLKTKSNLNLAQGFTHTFTNAESPWYYVVLSCLDTFSVSFIFTVWKSFQSFSLLFFSFSSSLYTFRNLFFYVLLSGSSFFLTSDSSAFHSNWP